MNFADLINITHEFFGVYAIACAKLWGFWLIGDWTIQTLMAAITKGKLEL